MIFIYKGFECWIEQEEEEDNIKNFHFFRKNGITKSMPLSPYTGKEAMFAWIDAGCPQPTAPRHDFSFVNGKLV